MIPPARKVLVVDDDPQVAEDHAGILRAIGYPSSAQTVPENVEPQLIRNPDIDLVLLDIRMPGLNGIELLPGHPLPLKHGDRIAIGDVHLRFESGD